MGTLTSRLSFVFFVLTILSSQLFAQDNLEKLKKTVESINNKAIKAAIEGDLETLYSFYADDVISMPNYGKMIKGKEALKKQDEEERKAGLKIHSMNCTTLNLWVWGDIVCDVGIYGISLTLPGMEQPVADIGKYLTIWQKQTDGSLKIKIEIWNTDMNPWSKGKDISSEKKD